MECDMATGLKAFFESLARPPRKFMVFGGACPSVTSPIATSVHWWNLVQLSYADTTPSLSQRDKYPHFFRTVPSQNDLGAARVKLFQLFNWTKIATLHQDYPRFSYAQSKQVKMAEENGITTIVEATFADNPRPALDQLKEKGARIVMGFFDEHMARRVFCEVYRAKMYGARHVWILPEYQSEWWKKHVNDTACTGDQIGQALKGYIATDILTLSANEEQTISGRTPLEYKALYDATRNGDYSDYHGYAYDGIWVMALAINHVIKMFEKENNLDAFFDFKYDDQKMLDHFSKAMNETNFPGVTGVVQFREGERLGCTMHKQLQDGEMVKVAEYYAITDSLNLSSGSENKFKWEGHGPPSDVQMLEILNLRVSKIVFAVLTTIATAGIIMAVYFLIFNMKSRNQRFIKMSSPFLNNLIIMGGILTYGSIFLLGLDHGMVGDNSFKAVCTARGWFLCIGFTLAFGAMFSKTWRVHRIFTNIKMKKKVIRDNQLYAIVGVMLVVDLIILITWQVVDPVEPREVRLDERQDPNGRDVILIPVMLNCKSQRTMIWLSIIYIYKGVLMIFGLFLAWETRHVSIPALNDSKYIGMSVYNVVIMCVLGVSLSFVITDNPNASYGLVSTFILFCTTITLCLVFGPKVIELRINPNANERIRVVGTLDKSRTCSTNAGTMDSECKLRGLAMEKNELAKKLSDQTKIVKDLETEYTKVAPEDAPLLFSDEWSSGLENSTMSARSRAESNKTATSPVSVTFNVHSSKINHTKEAVVTPQVTSSLSTAQPLIPRWSEEVPDDDDDDEHDPDGMDLYANFGGVYIGPPDKNEDPLTDPLTSDITSAGNTNSLDTMCTDGIAEFHRPFDDVMGYNDSMDIGLIDTHVPIHPGGVIDKLSPVQSVNEKLSSSGSVNDTFGMNDILSSNSSMNDTFSGLNNKTSSNCSVSNGGNTPTVPIYKYSSLLD
ncbi:gamma-aminobutyric acid type B receptor subunit 2 [Strongylocentrotus purpuratus]|uniref:G-protein coupled receptors family 3 profile domain-containing protein n=1 Tax=Strongylocentrotus purpuratus TaxID=7668 RepID=A0A7M7PC23_STRPU|nr:gamma-aminobutyric acid type B receptor subunit 2 [Strongylocentrotus purpuratus]